MSKEKSTPMSQLIIKDLNKDKIITVEIMETAAAISYKIHWETRHQDNEDRSIEIHPIGKRRN